MNLLFNISDLKDLLIDYYTLTKMRIAIFDEQFHEIASYPSQLSTYCHLIRSDGEAYKKCLQCDYNAFSTCKDTQRLHIYQCHAGLTEAIVPIMADQVIIGYIMLGQVLETGSKKDLWDEITQGLKAYKIDMKQLHKAYANKKNVSTNMIESSAKMMEICASYLYASHKLVLKKDSLAHRIDRFIGENLQEDLSVAIICEAFEIGKTKLYEIANESYGMGIAKHICQIRIQRAKEHLIDTDLPIYQIADIIGVEDYNYFTKMFKKETGTTPKMFRKENMIQIPTNPQSTRKD